MYWGKFIFHNMSYLVLASSVKEIIWSSDGTSKFIIIYYSCIDAKYKKKLPWCGRLKVNKWWKSAISKIEFLLPEKNLNGVITTSEYVLALKSNIRLKISVCLSVSSVKLRGPPLILKHGGLEQTFGKSIFFAVKTLLLTILRKKIRKKIPEKSR